MKVGVAGLWHLGSVTAACLAQAGLDVVGVDDASVIAGLAAGRAPLFEPGLDDLIAAGLASKHLRFSAEPAAALRDVDILWITYDTPVDDDDRADVEAVISRATELLPLLPVGAVVLISSQLPIGTTRRLRDAFTRAAPDRGLYFAYSPENLRLGQAIAAFVEANRIVVGCEVDAARQRLEPMLEKLGLPVIWMGIESAEMVKHTINAFLATSVTFINEVATLCERVGADASEVEAGIRSEPRIGRCAYVTPGGAFAGGTLARDVAFLSTLAATHGLASPLIGAILPSNQQHAGWAFRRIGELLGHDGAKPLEGLCAVVLGLTYKPNTSTLRRSAGLELCRQLRAAGAEVRAFDPAVQALPDEYAGVIRLASRAEAALEGADALVISTEWPAFATLDPCVVATRMRRPVVLDPNGFVAPGFRAAKGITYLRVGLMG